MPPIRAITPLLRAITRLPRAITRMPRKCTRIPAHRMECIDTPVRPHIAMALPPSMSPATPTAGLATLAATAKAYARGATRPEATRLAATAEAYARGGRADRHAPRAAIGRSAGARAAPL